MTTPRPATQAQLKSLRRWLLVAAAWATAATVIAVLAFLAANTDEEQRLAENNAELRQIQRNIAKRVATVRQELNGLPDSSAMTGLDARIRRLDRVTARTRQERQRTAANSSHRSPRRSPLSSSPSSSSRPPRSPVPAAAARGRTPPP